MSFCPKYINIRRGQMLAAFIGAWACVPWKILASAARFLAFLGGYTIFLGPMTAILITDYYITRRGNVSVPDMYDFHGIYRYSEKYATNWRAIAALVVGFAPPLPGFINNIAISQEEVPKPIVTAGGQHLFAIGYVYSFIAAGIAYWALMRFVPEQGSRMDHQETGEDIIVANDERKRSISKA
jgi:NCS1 family nucleobase:cation symporter-1